MSLPCIFTSIELLVNVIQTFCINIMYSNRQDSVSFVLKYRLIKTCVNSQAREQHLLNIIDWSIFPFETEKYLFKIRFVP